MDKVLKIHSQTLQLLIVLSDPIVPCECTHFSIQYCYMSFCSPEPLNFLIQGSLIRIWSYNTSYPPYCCDAKLGIVSVCIRGMSVYQTVYVRSRYVSLERIVYCVVHTICGDYVCPVGVYGTVSVCIWWWVRYAFKLSLSNENRRHEPVDRWATQLTSMHSNFRCFPMI